MIKIADIIWIAVCQNAALIKQDRAIAHRNDLVDRVTHEQNGFPLLLERPNPVERLQLKSRIADAQGLIDDQHVRISRRLQLRTSILTASR